MLISQSWIEAILRTTTPGWSVSSEDLDTGFVSVGFETEGYEALPQTSGPLVWGQVVDFEELEGFKKPIRYCQVNVGDANGSGELQNIICGARNFERGSIVAVALPGAVLPGDFAISARETYGKTSEGMMCSFTELGIGSDASGIIAISEDELDAAGGKISEDARGILGLHDTVFDVNITPDRGYALSARGLSREIASSFNLPFQDPAQNDSALGTELDLPLPLTGDTVLDVTLDPAVKARRFGVRKVTGVDPSAQSPLWLQRELLLSGQRPVNVPTDITNYVMFLLGQPLHAFDAQKISGTLAVRLAHSGEKFTTLDGTERSLREEDVVITDDSGIQSLAGVMGGQSSEITDETTDVYFEAANWDPIVVARSSRRHKLSTEASRRFERGVDSALVEYALDLAAGLLATIAGGKVESGRTLLGEVQKQPVIEMPVSYPSTIVGVEYAPETVVRRLEEIGADISDPSSEILSVTPPTWRSDLTEKIELVEEVLRLEGLDAIPSIVPAAPVGNGLSARQRVRRAVGRGLAWSGFAEILPSPFISNDVFDQWGLDADDPRRNAVTVLNPLESDYATIGTTLLPSMMDALKRNVDRGQKDAALYGIEQVTQPKNAETISPILPTGQRATEDELKKLIDSIPAQPLHVAMIATGQRQLSGPWGESEAFSAHDAIEVARVIAASVGDTVIVQNAEMAPWHPGRCAALKLASSGEVVGYAGELHPQVLERMNLPARTIALEMDMTNLGADVPTPAPELSPFPALFQDTALVVDENVPSSEVEKALHEHAGDLLEDICLFDVYRSEGLGEGKKSLTFSLKFRAPDRTLTDEEVTKYREDAVAFAQSELGAEQRA